MPYWDERVEAMAKNYPKVKDQYTSTSHREFCAASGLVRRRGRLEPVRRYPLGCVHRHRHRAVQATSSARTFPVGVRAGHWPTPISRGRDRQSDRHDLSGAMMLEHLGEKEAAASIVAASERHARERTLRTRDLGGNADTTLRQAVATCGVRGFFFPSPLVGEGGADVVRDG